MRIERIVDLSVVLREGTPVYPGDPEPHFTVHSTIKTDGFNLLSVQMGSQSGTHVDAPYHFDETAPKLDELPLDRFLGPGVIVDVRGIAPRTAITWDRIAPVADLLVPGSIVLLHTGWSQYFGSAAYYDNPYLDADACRRLIERGVLTFGIDALNIDETPDATHPGVGYPVHHLIAEAAGVIAENLTNLDSVDFADPLISLLPLAFEGADGAPVRAVAIKLNP
ncbi:cyclase family protein [Leifsonia kafniensis]|uniref:Cyclase family protein n=1 Tax=Leifsonia kafniensis TaxID=475957 RepID=A0ABP7L1N2_9MICO